ncbi:MAG: L-seryl-tRNA(Sec) selenium transferase [Candidatus Krumholzibacteriia bacterium]
MPRTARFRILPKVDQILEAPALQKPLRRLPREIVVRFVQQEVDGLRKRVATLGDGAPTSREEAQQDIATRVRIRLDELTSPTLRRVVNATGVVLHTNIGRAPLSDAAVAAVVEAARGYINLEYDLEAGVRTSRMVHLDALLRELMGAEAAFVVNNNAAAVLLAIDTLGQAGVVVSRGEQVEIGDSFRLPEILSKAGVPIHEVGTTNRTTPRDYDVAAREPGCVLLKVHRSNFAMHGFTCEASIQELAEVARRRQATLVFDLGSGSLEPFAAHGLVGEPDVKSALHAGAHVVTMSGDKLLGGPQAGILAGSRQAVQAMRRNPLARALRIDKLTLAALQATLLSYVGGGAQDVPARRLILSKPDDIEARARRLLERLEGRVEAVVELVAGQASVGGGSFADAGLPSYEVRVRPRRARATELLAQLRRGTPAVMARIKDDFVGLDVRCVADDDVGPLAQAVEAALATCGGVE